MSRGCSGGFGRFSFEARAWSRSKSWSKSWIKGWIKSGAACLGERWGGWVSGARCKYVHVSSVAASMRLRAPDTHPPQRFQNWLVRLGSRAMATAEAGARAPVVLGGRKSCRAWLGNTSRSRAAWVRWRFAFACDFAVPCEPTHCPRAGLCGLPGPCVAMDGNTEPPWMDLRRAPETHTGLPSPAQTRNRFGRGCGCGCGCGRRS